MVESRRFDGLVFGVLRLRCEVFGQRDDGELGLGRELGPLKDPLFYQFGR